MKNRMIQLAATMLTLITVLGSSAVTFALNTEINEIAVTASIEEFSAESVPAAGKNNPDFVTYNNEPCEGGILYEADTPAEPGVPEGPDNPEEPIEETDPNAPVVTMYLCATARTFTGHVWLYFDNIGTEPAEVGYVTLEPGCQTSVGSLRNTRSNGGGTYYNGEAYMAKDIEKTGKHTTYLQMNLTRAQLAVVSEQIKSRNSYNLIVWNCGNFAAAVWNSVSKDKIVHITFPVFTILQMKIHGGKKGLIMTRPPIEKVYKQVSDGVVNAQEKSFRLSCV